MFVKWIEATVAAGHRPAFSRAQSQWSAIASTPGLVGQVGGWSGDVACVLSLWSDSDSYESFMTDVHDVITEASDQGATYSHLRVRLFLSRFPMPGSRNSFGAGLTEATFLRVADCVVAPERVRHFESAQQTIWRPAMATAAGMLAGIFSVGRADSNSFLVTTLWSNEESHARYVSDDVPRLRDLADAGADMMSITGHAFVLEPSWTVVPR